MVLIGHIIGIGIVIVGIIFIIRIFRFMWNDEPETVFTTKIEIIPDKELKADDNGKSDGKLGTDG